MLAAHALASFSEVFRPKEAQSVWYETLHQFLVEIGFERIYAGSGVYRRARGGQKVLLSVYLDDVLVFAQDINIDRVDRKIGNRFEIRDLGAAAHVLGIEVLGLERQLATFSHTGYVRRVLEDLR